MAFLHSTRLCLKYGVAPNANIQLFTVPAGQRVSVKSIQVIPYSNAAGALLLRATPSSAIFFRANWADNKIAQVTNLSVVIHETEGVSCTWNTSDAYITMSGFLFDGAGGPLAQTEALDEALPLPA